MKGINFDIRSEEDKSWRDKLPLLKSKEKIAENAREYAKEVAEKAVDDAIEEITATYEDIIGDLQANYDRDNKYHDRFYESLRLSNTKIENEEQIETIMKESSTITSGDFAVYSDIDADLEQTYGERAEAQRVAYIRGMKDPILGAIADTYTRWVVGRGVKFSFQDHKVQKVVDKFWGENNMDSKLKERYWRFVLESEMFSVLHKDSQRGKCYVRDVNPREITAVETHPEDKQNRFAYKREFRDADGNLHVMYYPDIEYYDDYRDGKLSVQKSSYEDKDDWTGRNTVMHYLKWMNNREVRSRVFLQRVMKWVEWFKDWIIDRAIINHEKGRVVWILTVTSEKMRKKLGNVVSAPAGGKIKVETPNRKWQPVSADIRADNVKEDGMFLMYQICTGVSIPLHVLTQRVSEQVYSSIRKSETPFSMAILDKQHTLSENYIKPLLKEVIRTAAKSDGNKTLNRKIRIDDYVRESIRREFKGLLKDYRNDDIDSDGLLESIKELSDRSLQDIRNSSRAARAKARLSKNLESLRKSCNKSYVKLIESGFNEEEIQEDVNDILAESYDLFESGVTVQINAEECPAKITFPDLVKEDYLEMAKVLKIYDETGLYSKETLREKAGCDDPSREKYLIKQEMKEWEQRGQETQERQQDNTEESSSSDEEPSEEE